MELICGINPVVEALGAGTRHFDHLLVAKGTRNRRVSEALSLAGQAGVPLRFESREALDRMAGGVNHQGIIAVVSAKAVTGLEPILDAARDPALLLLLDGVEDPRNLGAILRTAEAAGVDGVVLPERRSAPLSQTVARSSAGALEYVNVARVGNLVRALETVKQRGIWVVGFDAAGSERWDAIDCNRPLAVVLGGEGRGIRRLVRENCDHVASLPLFGHVASLNVSVVAGIALYEVVRQRRAEPSHVRPIPLRASLPDRVVVGPSPDDSEHDPGRLVSGPLPAADPDDEEFESDGPRLLIEEEAAWSSAPTIIERREQRRRRPGGRPRPGGGSRAGGARGEPQRGESQRPQSAAGPSEGNDRRRQRGRRRRPGGGRKASEAAPGGGPRSAPETDPGAGSGEPPASPEARPGGRRRRRRRRR